MPTDTAALQEFVAGAAEALGGLDYVWSNVGVQIGGSVEHASPADFDVVRHQRARPRRRLRRRGAASACGRRRRDLHHGFQLRAALGAATRALRRHEGGRRWRSRQVARDYSSEGIRVNALCPGWIDTPFNTPAWENFGGRERFLAEVPRLVPLGRIGSAEEAGRLACFLLSDDAAYMTGHALVADGGECLPG